MPTFTILNLTVPLRPDAPAAAIGFLRASLAPGGGPGGPGVPAVPCHPFFAAGRWRHLLSPHGGSGLHLLAAPGPTASLGPAAGWPGPVLRLRSSFRDLHGEAGLFLGWLSPLALPLAAGTRVGVRACDAGFVADVAWSGAGLRLERWRGGEIEGNPRWLRPWPLPARRAARDG